MIKQPNALPSGSETCVEESDPPPSWYAVPSSEEAVDRGGLVRDFIHILGMLFDFFIGSEIRLRRVEREFASQQRGKRKKLDQ